MFCFEVLYQKTWKGVRQYLSDMEGQASLRLDSGDVCGRFDICADVMDSMQLRGSLTCVTGHRSVGKSKIVTDIVKSLEIAYYRKTYQLFLRQKCLL
jgi:hypothetical protein